MAMRAHEQAEHSNEARQRRPRSGSTAATNATDVERILALQRAAGNAAVTSVLSGQVVQRADAAAGGGQAGNRGSVTNRERELTARFGIRIGPAPGQGGEHFTHALLDRIESALLQLPQEDVSLNQRLIAIEMDPDPEGSATLYSSATRSIGVVRPVLAGPARVPDWLYAKLNTDSAGQRRLMNRGAMADYEGVTPAGDRALGIASGARQVFGAQGNLVKWTIRHEVGHAVDANAGWDPILARQEHFGGWRTYPSYDLEDVARAILKKAGLDAVVQKLGTIEQRTAISSLASKLDPGRIRGTGAAGLLEQYFSRYQPHLSPEDFTRCTAAATRFVQLAAAQPWTLDDGGAATLDVDDHIYQVDHYDEWVSYSTEQRRYRVSNYQFSTPAEWFAEAYSAYYNLKRPELRARLHPRVQAWFATIPRPGAAEQQEAPA